MIINYIYKLSRVNSYDEKQLLIVEQTVLLNILKYHIIQNEDLDERKFIFEELVKNTFINNTLNTSNAYYNYLSIIFQCFYAYTILEVETLREDYRENIKKLFQTDISTPNIGGVNMGMLIKMNIEGILCAIALRIKEEDEFARTFEYFPPYIGAKSTVWTKTFDIRFMFFVYMLYNDEVGFYSLYGRFFKWKEMNNVSKLEILNELMRLFDYNKGVLKKNIIDDIKKLADLMKYSFLVSEDKQIKLFKYIREEQEKLFLKNVNKKEIPKLDLEDIKQQLNKLMERENVFGWDANYNDDFYVKYSTPDCIRRKTHIDNISAARNIQRACLSAINNYINSSTSKLELSFDKKELRKY